VSNGPAHKSDRQDGSVVPSSGSGAGVDAGSPSAFRLSVRRARRRARLNVNLTSLIDVTFLLLVYFMVATSFAATEEAFRIDLPDRTSGGPGDPFELDDEPLRIQISSIGSGPDDYRVQIDGPYPQPQSLDELMGFLQQHQIGSDLPEQWFKPDHPIIIVPTTGARWEHTIGVLNAAARARYTNVTFGKPG
jgi:biopolymer transport protein ExbD